MLAFVFLKIIATTITLAGGGSGGVFAPSLFIGAMLGGIFGHTVHSFFPEITANYGPYALVGMAAFFSSTGRATFTAIVILFEMTLDYSIILPLMFACVTADQVSFLLSRDSIYSLKLRRKGFRYKTEFSADIMALTPVKEVMTTVLHSAQGDMSFEHAAKELLQYEHSTYPVTDAKGYLKGILTSNQIIKMNNKDPKALVKNHMFDSGAVVSSNELVGDVLKKFERTRDPRILVTDPYTKRLVGILSPVDLIRLNSSQED
jgi:CIC family chloride channel protein